MSIALEQGKTYRVKLTSGRWTDAEFLGQQIIGGFGTAGRGLGGGPRSRNRTRYDFRNIASGRTITLKSMAKIKAAEGAQ